MLYLSIRTQSILLAAAICRGYPQADLCGRGSFLCEHRVLMSFKRGIRANRSNVKLDIFDSIRWQYLRSLTISKRCNVVDIVPRSRWKQRNISSTNFLSFSSFTKRFLYVSIRCFFLFLFYFFYDTPFSSISRTKCRIYRNRERKKKREEKNKNIKFRLDHTPI